MYPFATMFTLGTFDSLSSYFSNPFLHNLSAILLNISRALLASIFCPNFTPVQLFMALTEYRIILSSSVSAFLQNCYCTMIRLKYISRDQKGKFWMFFWWIISKPSRRLFFKMYSGVFDKNPNFAKTLGNEAYASFSRKISLYVRFKPYTSKTFPRRRWEPLTFFLELFL